MLNDTLLVTDRSVIHMDIDINLSPFFEILRYGLCFKLFFFNSKKLRITFQISCWGICVCFLYLLIHIKQLVASGFFFYILNWSLIGSNFYQLAQLKDTYNGSNSVKISQLIFYQLDNLFHSLTTSETSHLFRMGLISILNAPFSSPSASNWVVEDVFFFLLFFNFGCSGSCSRCSLLLLSGPPVLL